MLTIEQCNPTRTTGRLRVTHDSGCSSTVPGEHLHSTPRVPFAAAFVRALTAPLRWFVPPRNTVRYETCEEWCDAAEESIVDAARRALDAERVDDLSELLTDFADDLDTLRFLAIGEDANLVTEPVERHPIAYLYARRVAQLAGVALADDEEARRAYVAARETCEWLSGMDGWLGGRGVAGLSVQQCPAREHVPHGLLVEAREDR